MALICRRLFAYPQVHHHGALTLATRFSVQTGGSRHRPQRQDVPTRVEVDGDRNTVMSRAAAETAPRSSVSSAQTPHPMEVLHRTFHAHPSTLRLYRELTIALASGRADDAADIASALALAVKRLQTESAPPEHTSSEKAKDTEVDTADELPPPPVGADDLKEAVEATQRAVIGGRTDRNHSPVHTGAHAESATSASPFWRQPENLSVTVLESAFETDEAADAGAAGLLSEAGSRALEYEERQLAVLDEYLRREADRWAAQKSAIAKLVLDTARAAGLSPADLHAAEGGRDGATDHKLNVLRHANVVVRGEAPATAATGSARDKDAVQQRVDEELRVLQERMRTRYGKPMAAVDVEMARYELLLSLSTMRYVVGLHRDLQLALDTSESVRAKRVEWCTQHADSKITTGSQFFVHRLMEELHKTPVDLDVSGVTARAAPSAPANSPSPLTVERLRLAESLNRPVLPFTFLLKCCLWFVVPGAE